MELTRWQWLRTRAYLFAVGVKRRMVLGVRVVLIEEDKVLLIRQTYLPGWQFPGGGVEPGETAEASGAREVLEETGYEVAGPMQLFGLYLNRNFATNRDHIAVYLCRDFAKSHEFTPNYEIAEARWFPVAHLPADTTPGTLKRLNEIFEGAPQAAVW